MIRLTSKGDYERTRKFIEHLKMRNYYKNLNQYGEMGVRALSQSTPVRTGLTAASWKYRIIHNKDKPGIEWYNTNIKDGTSIAILIQYGHGTGTGGYVSGRDYINPAMRPVFDKIVDSVWKEVTSWQT